MEKPLIPLSFVAEYEYCPRSAFYLLTDAPRARDENSFIQSGRKEHGAVDEGYQYSKSAKKVESSVTVFSEKLGIIGKVDMLEFYSDSSIVPVELKRGKKRVNTMHQVQLALMALCLREMFPKSRVESGAIFFAEDRKKVQVDFTDELLGEAEKIANDVVEKVKKGTLPANFPMIKDERCKGCCFYDLCYL